MKVLVTGGSGLVGSAIKQVQDEFPDYELYAPSSEDYNLLDYLETQEMMYNFKPDSVVHLAANVGGLYKNMNQKPSMFDHNIIMNMNIVRACYDHDVNRLIGYLSTCIFPDKSSYPINESQLHDGPPHSSNDAYAYAKRMLQVQCDAYNSTHGTNYGCIIPTNVYGRNDNYHLEDSHVIPGLIHRCYLAKLYNEPFVVRGTGKVLRQFIHAADLARATLKLLPVLNKDTVIVAGDECEVTIQQVATMIAEQFDYVDHITFDASYSDGQYKKTADNSKFKTLAPDFEFQSLDTGIADTVNYFIDNYDTLRK